MLEHPATRRGYWGRWYYKDRYEKVWKNLSKYCENNRIRIYDLGCGSGIYARYLEEAGCRCHYVGCDSDSESLRSAHRGQSIDYVRCDLQRLPFVKRSAEVILCSEVLEHLYSPYEVLAEICEIADGALIITFPEEQLLSVFKDRHPEHVSAIDMKTVMGLLVSKKFRLVQSCQIFSSLIPCGILEFLRIPRNRLTQTIVGSVDRLLKEILPTALVPHRTMLVKAELTDGSARLKSNWTSQMASI